MTEEFSSDMILDTTDRYKSTIQLLVRHLPVGRNTNLTDVITESRYLGYHGNDAPTIGSSPFGRSHYLGVSATAKPMISLFTLCSDVSASLAAL